MARKYTRDNRGRFASGGGGATARGGRLKTASGNKRKTQTMKAAGAGGAGVMKGAVKRDPGAMAKVGKAAKAPKQLSRAEALRQKASTISQRADKMMRLEANPGLSGDRAITNVSINNRQRSSAISQGLKGYALKQKADALLFKAANIQRQSDMQRAKKLRAAHEKEIVNRLLQKRPGAGTKAEARAALRGLEPDKQISLIRKWVAANRATLPKAPKRNRVR